MTEKKEASQLEKACVQSFGEFLMQVERSLNALQTVKYCMERAHAATTVLSDRMGEMQKALDAAMSYGELDRVTQEYIAKSTTCEPKPNL